MAAFHALPAMLFHGLARATAGSGLIPYGTLGDARLVLAIVAMVLAIATPPDPPIPALAFFLFAVAAGLCGVADGAWVGAMRRHLGLPPVRALRTYLREIGRKEDGTWLMMTGGRP